LSIQNCPLAPGFLLTVKHQAGVLSLHLDLLLRRIGVEVEVFHGEDHGAPLVVEHPGWRSRSAVVALFGVEKVDRHMLHPFGAHAEGDLQTRCVTNSDLLGARAEVSSALTPGHVQAAAADGLPGPLDQLHRPAGLGRKDILAGIEILLEIDLYPSALVNRLEPPRRQRCHRDAQRCYTHQQHCNCTGHRMSLRLLCFARDE
jgi:hypothetical protein